MAEDPVVIVPLPALVAILLNVETTNGKPLTEAEVLAIRDSAVCMTMPYSSAAAIVAKRGYDDVRPENVWEDWQAVRPSLYP